jgi:hypothetical protein
LWVAAGYIGQRLDSFNPLIYFWVDRPGVFSGSGADETSNVTMSLLLLEFEFVEGINKGSRRIVVWSNEYRLFWFGVVAAAGAELEEQQALGSGNGRYGPHYGCIVGIPRLNSARYGVSNGFSQGGQDREGRFGA